MKNETKYHVANGLAGIYAGTLRADGESWKRKSEVTEEAIAAVRDYMIEHRITSYEWKRKAGGTVRLMIEVEEESK